MVSVSCRPTSLPQFPQESWIKTGLPKGLCKEVRGL